MSDMKVGDTVYRYIDAIYSTGDPEGGDYCTRVEVKLHEYKVIMITPKGFRIDYYPTTKFILSDANKKFACETTQLAMWSFLRRKACQKKILEAQLRRTNQAISRAERMNAGDSKL